MAHHDEASGVTVREARAAFFRANGFGAHGGYDDRWAEAEFGSFVYRVPNTRARAEALEVHDLHHLATGYAADWRGEAEISAWELASGWGRYAYAWIIALFGFFTGLVAQPLKTYRAFARGSRSRNLYRRESVDELLDRPLSELTELLQTTAGSSRQSARPDVPLRFLLTAIVALAFGALSAPFVLGFVFVGEARRAAQGLRCPSSYSSGCWM